MKIILTGFLLIHFSFNLIFSQPQPKVTVLCDVASDIEVTDLIVDNVTKDIIVSTKNGIYKIKGQKLVEYENYYDSKYLLLGDLSPEIDMSKQFNDLCLFENTLFSCAPPRIDYNPSAREDGGVTYKDKGRGGLFRLDGNNVITDNSINPAVVAGDLLCAFGNYLAMYSWDYKAILFYSSYNDGVFGSYNSISTSDYQYVPSITCANKSDLYVYFSEGVLYKVNEDTITYTTYEDNSALSHSTGIINADSQDNIWLATNDYLFSKDSEKWDSINYPDYAIDNEIKQAIGKNVYIDGYLIDSKNNHWISTSKSFIMYDGSKWHNVSEELGIKSKIYVISNQENNIYIYYDDKIARIPIL